MQLMQLTVSNIYKSYREKAGVIEHVLRNISINFKQGASYAIIGPSGTGKSTLLHILAGLDAPDSGTIYCDGQNIVALSSEQRAVFLQKTVGLLFQQPYLIKELSVLENVMAPGLFAGYNTQSCRREAIVLLAKMGVKEKSESKPSSL